MGTYERASQRTRKTLREAFWSLYQEKPLEQITIREIAGRAGLNRGTFYAYYSRAADILEEIESALLDAVRSGSSAVLDEPPSEEEILLRLAYHYQRYSRYFDVLLGENGDAGFQDRLCAQIRENLRPVLFPQGGMETEFSLAFLAGGIIQMLLCWHSVKPKLSTEEFLSVLRRLITSRAVRPSAEE